MRYNESFVLAFIQHKVDVILRNGPLDELATYPSLCFLRLMDVFCEEGPRDKREVSGYRVAIEMARRDAATMEEDPHGVRLLMSHTQWVVRYVSGRPLRVEVTVPEREWEYTFYEPYNIGSLIAVDHYMPELVRQADILSMLARILLAKKEASAPVDTC